jgi:hypothetical protein
MNTQPVLEPTTLSFTGNVVFNLNAWKKEWMEHV